MAVYALGALIPEIAPSAFVHPDAVIIGAVQLGPHSSVWPSAVLRGDYGQITVGEATSVQDGCVLHTDSDAPTALGRGCIVGHLAYLEGCRVEDDCLIGAGAIVLRGASIGTGATVAAGALVRERAVVPPGRLVTGVPARVTAGGWSIEAIRRGAAVYVETSRRYRAELRRID